MSEIPDKVIEEAHGAAGRAWTDAEPWRGPRAFAGVIAGWARAEGAAKERERIREAIAGPEALEAAHEVGLKLANSDGPKEIPDGDYLGGSAMVAGILLAGLDTALAALDRDGSDTREGEQ